MICSIIIWMMFMLKSDKLSNSYIWVLNRFISSDCKTTYTNICIYLSNHAGGTHWTDSITWGVSCQSVLSMDVFNYFSICILEMNYRKMFYFAVAATYIMYCSCKSLSLMYMEQYTDIQYLWSSWSANEYW